MSLYWQQYKDEEHSYTLTESFVMLKSSISALSASANSVFSSALNKSLGSQSAAMTT